MAMEKFYTTSHFKEDRVDRATYIASTVGFGNIVKTRQTYDHNGRLTNSELHSTGVIIIKSYDNALVTMYIATRKQAFSFFREGEKCPAWLLKRVDNNKKKGYLEGQPGYQE